MICRNSFQDHTISLIIPPISSFLFFHSFPQSSSVNEEKKIIVGRCMCLCVFVFMCVCVCV